MEFNVNLNHNYSHFTYKDDFEYNNPQAYIYPNGTILMIYARTKCPSNSSYAGKNICFGISKSDGFDKPFEFIKQMNTNIEGEDGYFWRDINGYFHMIYHTLSPNKFGITCL